MKSNIAQLLLRLRSVITQENRSLKAGDLRALNQTLDLKQSLLTDLNAHLFAIPPEQRDGRLSRDLERVGYMLKDNERLMKSAINSVRFAYKQISALKLRQSKVGAYGRDGRVLHIPENKQAQFRMV